ncbi:alpha/beta hydrolase [bacterium]|nr:MAG: alpha/beta hydrolase [bacterium]
MSVSKLLVAISFALCAAVPVLAAEAPAAIDPVVVPVWPTGQMPGKGADEPEGVKPANDKFTRVTNISTPSLTVYRAPAADKPAPAVLICPGGGYSYAVVDKEGTEIAAWLNTLGITGIVLKYRVPNNRAGAFQDAVRAVRLVRSHAKDWNVDTAKIGAMGFSAGGHLCARLSTNFATAPYEKIDEIDQLDCRPDFVVLVYPAYLGKDGQLAPELPVSDKVPATFIVHSEDDTPFVPGSKIYDAALTQSGVPHEYALYQTGGHGYGLHCEREAKLWPERCRAWLKEREII